MKYPAIDHDSDRSTEAVLIITYYWPPSGGAGVQRFLKFVKYLPDCGLKPVVLTCANPSYPLLDPSLEEDIPEGTAVYLARTVEPFSLYSSLSGKPLDVIASPSRSLGTNQSGVSQKLIQWIRANIFIPDARAGWIPFARKKALELIRQHSISSVITTGPPHSTHYIGKYLKKKAGIRWIADFRDPWTDIHYNQVLPRTCITRWIDRKLEASVLTAADEITVTAPGTARYFSEKVDRSYHVITNGFDPDDFGPPPAADKKEASFVIRHIGSIMETSFPTSLINVLSEPEFDKCTFEFIGGIHPGLKEKAAQPELKKVLRFTPYLPHKEAVKKMQEADINVVIVHQSTDSRILIPGKVFDYLKAGKPILVLGPPDGDAASIVHECRAGKAFDYEDINGIRKWLLDCIQAKKDRAVSSPDVPAVMEYARPALTRKLAGVLLGPSGEKKPPESAAYQP
ncbi:hypothetical protein QLX67_00785 [Balneolaceae bacterium ANBcel3]|nr:hypothetical protein [Balneolaceae bacterium ANBcel3]